MDGSLSHGRHGRQDPEAAVSPEDIRRFILANTSPSRPPHAGEIVLFLADEAHELWHRTEVELDAIGLPPPVWAFAWAGGQGLARYILDHPAIVRGRRVLDLASGSGLVAIAAALSGAAHVIANDIDPFALEAIGINAGHNGVGGMEVLGGDLLAAGAPPTDCEIILAGDIFYDRNLAALALPWPHAAAQGGAVVLVGDPGRAYLPRRGLEELAVYEVAVTRELEDSEVKRTRVWRMTGAAPLPDNGLTPGH